MRKHLVSILLLLALVVSACGGDEEAPTATSKPADTQAPTDTAPAVSEPSDAAGQLQLAGSSTVQPLAEELAEAFMAMNPDLVIEIQGGGSSVGVTSAGEGTVDIGNASRNVKSSEMEKFPNLQIFTIAYDGIAIVTHLDTEIPSLSIEQAQAIFAGEITNYNEVGGPDADIIVVSREEGSGTREAFTDLVMDYNDVEKQITERALLQQSNGQVRTTVATTPDAIGYLSFGFLDESTNAVPIDGVAPTVSNVLNGSYPIFRPLNMMTDGAPNEQAQAFLDFIMSDAGQAIVAEEYIPVSSEAAEAPSSDAAGQLQLAGSSTVQPLAEELAEAFMAMNPDLIIEIQGGGSSVGVTSAGEGTVDIGNASRNVKSSEMEKFPNLQIFTIAYDGIAIVTHPGTEIPSLSIEQAQAIFAGEITNYNEVGGPDADIIVVSREEGSGTREAFTDLVMDYNDVEKQIAARALLQQSNGQVRTTVATTPDAIGYLSFGFLDESTNAVPIDGVAPTVSNVLNGSYPIFRPLNMMTNGAPNEQAQAFLDFIMSDAGQAIVAEEYIPVSAEVAEAPSGDAAGQLQLAGSSTVQPLAEELAEAFMAMNPDLIIEIQGGGSSVGVTSAGEGTVDIGNASRNVKSSEMEKFPNLQIFTIAYDGIAIVTHPGTEIPSLSIEQAQAIFAGEITNYNEVGGPDADIIVVSREEGSGTREAFTDLVMDYNDVEKQIAARALLQQSNGQVRTTVATTPDAIGYLSFGFLDESTNAVPIDGVAPTVSNVVNGSYPIFRPLNMMTNGAPNEQAQAFLDYILGEGQAIVAEDYIPVGTEVAEGEPAAYEPPTDLSGQLQLAGSSTVQPLAEKLAEALMAMNPDLIIEIQGGGSSVGVTSAGEGTVDIGNASRNVKSSEMEKFPNLQIFTIAYDGIAIVTHPDIEIPSLSIEQAQAIFAGEITNYNEVGGPDADIIVVSREEGSGTREAFTDLVMDYNDVEKQITERALLQQSNGQVRTTVATTPDAIGYLSFGFLDESTNAVPIDGVAPEVENVVNGSYPIFRPLNMMTNGAPNDLAQAFLDYILSSIGQEIVAEDYIAVE